jgi:hypothetical protein
VPGDDGGGGVAGFAGAVGAAAAMGFCVLKEVNGVTCWVLLKDAGDVGVGVTVEGEIGCAIFTGDVVAAAGLSGVGEAIVEVDVGKAVPITFLYASCCCGLKPLVGLFGSIRVSSSKQQFLSR